MVPTLLDIAGILMLAAGVAMLIASGGYAVDVWLMADPRYWEWKAEIDHKRDAHEAAVGLSRLAYFSAKAGIDPQKIVPILLREMESARGRIVEESCPGSSIGRALVSKTSDPGSTPGGFARWDQGMLPNIFNKAGEASIRG